MNISWQGRFSPCPTSLNNALTDIRPLPTRAAPIYHGVRPSTMKPDHQPPGHGVLAPAAMLPDSAGTKWQQMATNGAVEKKIRIWDGVTSYKKSVKSGVICPKACKNPAFPDQTVTFSGKAPALTNGPAKTLSVHQPASLMSALPVITGQSLCDVFVQWG